MTTVLKKLLEQDRINEPAKGWRNWYEVTRQYKSRQSGLVRKPGDIIHGVKVWPSKDTAETWAAENKDNPRYGETKHLGAFPEGERP